MAKVALVSSAGGHLTQALTIAGELSGEHEFFLCVTSFPAVQNMKLEEVKRIYYTPVYWGYQLPFGIIVSLVVTLFSFLRILRKEQPDFIITTGAEIALPALLVNRFYKRRPSLYVESLTHTEIPSLTGKIVSHLVNRVFVQWPALLKHYGANAEYHGRLL